MLQTTTTMEEVMTTVKPRLGVTLLMREPMVTITCARHIISTAHIYICLSPARRSRRGPARCRGRPRPGCRTRGSPCRSPGGGGRCARWSPGGLGSTQWLIRMPWAQQCLDQTITRDLTYHIGPTDTVAHIVGAVGQRPEASRQNLQGAEHPLDLE